MSLRFGLTLMDQLLSVITGSGFPIPGTGERCLLHEVLQLNATLLRLSPSARFAFSQFASSVENQTLERSAGRPASTDAERPNVKKAQLTTRAEGDRGCQRNSYKSLSDGPAPTRS
jgi:hypothetical protein